MQWREFECERNRDIAAGDAEYALGRSQPEYHGELHRELGGTERHLEQRGTG